MKKCLVLFLGESFRYGPQDNRNTGCPLSFDEQKKACFTHIDFCKNIEEKYNCEIDIIVNSYNTQYNNDLIQWYTDYKCNSQFIFNTDYIGISNLYKNSVLNSNVNINTYDYVVYIRVDIVLSEFFKNKFYFSEDKILFTSACFSFNNFHIHYNYPRVVDMFMCIPKKYYSDQLFNNIEVYHSAWWWLKQFDQNIEIDFLTYTMHDSDSQKDWNPFYYIANRPCSENWYDAGKILNPKTLQIEPSLKYINKESFNE